MSSYLITTQDEKLCASYLAAGRLVAFPTGTSYGLAADTLQGYALQRLRNLKGRLKTKSFTVFMPAQLYDEFLELTASERKILQQFLDQPLTLLVSPSPRLAHLAQAGKIGLRVIDHPLMQKLAEAAPAPLTATSANLSGQDPCLSIACLTETFRNPLPDKQLAEVDPAGSSGTTYDLSLAAILDGGELSAAPSTTIAIIEQGKIRLVRPGSISQQVLQQALQV